MSATKAEVTLTFEELELFQDGLVALGANRALLGTTDDKRNVRLRKVADLLSKVVDVRRRLAVR